jgi:hypothetical protein
VPSRKLSDEFQNVDPINALKGLFAPMVLKPNEKLAGIAKVLGTARRNEATRIAEMLIVFAKNNVEGIVGESRCRPGDYLLLTKILPQLVHVRASLLEDPLGGEFLFYEALDQALSDLLNSLDALCPCEVVELACQA